MNNKDVPDTKLLGQTKTVDGRLYLTGLEENLLGVDDKGHERAVQRMEIDPGYLQQPQPH